MKARKAVLTEIELPDFGAPTLEPSLGGGIYELRLSRLLTSMTDMNIDAMVIYGDREHLANVCWLTGYDPRFEEAICIVVPGRTPHLLCGNEGFSYAELAEGVFERVLWQPLSLMGQPRGQYRPLAAFLAEAGLVSGMRIGLAGWKGFETETGAYDPAWFESPHYLVASLSALGPMRNCADIFMSPDGGLRIHNEIEQLARFEFAATLSSRSIRQIILAARPGRCEYEVAAAAASNGFMQSIHMNFCSGPRAKFGLPSPSFRILEHGDPIVAGIGLMGALNCRAGFLVEDAQGLPQGIRDYVEKLVAPYFRAAVAWYETIGIGVSGGEIFDNVMEFVGDPFFGIGLNPGHFIHLDEWVHSPIKRGSIHRLQSGMALQCDIIPATGTSYFMSNIEDGIGILDAEARATFAQRFPEAWTRIEARRSFMINQLGIRLKPEVLPFSNLAAWLPPFWLAPDKAMAMRNG